MTRSVRTFVGAIGVSALGLAPVVAVTAGLVLYPTQVDARGGNSGNGGDRGDGRNGEHPRNRGTVASELKGLNAAHANPTAMQNAVPNSRVGQIAAYKDAALATQEAAGNVAAATEALAAAEAALAEAEAVAASAEENEAAALLEAANGRELSPEAIEELRELLGL